MTQDKLLDLTITLAPSAQSQNQVIVYNNVVNWDWDQMNGLNILLEDDAKILLNTSYVIAVVEKEAVEPEQPELWDVEDEEESDG